MLLFATNCKTTNAIALDCSYVNVPHSIVGSLYTCAARVLFDTEHIDDVLVVYGAHQGGNTNDDVHGLAINSQNMPFFPRNVESFFPNLKAFNFYNNSISNVSNNHLIPFPKLEFLDLQENFIDSLDGNLFTGLTSLKFISFNFNEVKHIGHDINLPDTGSISFESNPCINQTAITPAEIVTLKHSLLVNCPPTISQIEDALESRQNFITDLKIDTLELQERVRELEAIIIENKKGGQ